VTCSIGAPEARSEQVTCSFRRAAALIRAGHLLVLEVVGCLTAGNLLARASMGLVLFGSRSGRLGTCRCAPALVVLSALLGQACTIEQPVSGPVLLTTEWLTIEPPKPLRVEKREEQQLCLEVGQMRDLEFDRGVALDNARGERHTIEGEAVDSEGAVYAMKVSAAGGHSVYLYRAGKPIAGPDFPADRTIVRLRLRSQPPLEVKGIRWLSNDQF
jgi:hypothetical protein